jgi:hypothetical protein
MGYPMTYKRVINRNQLMGDYGHHPSGTAIEPGTVASPQMMIGGDMRRLEVDQRDERHVARYAELAGITVEQVKIVLDALFEGDF